MVTLQKSDKYLYQSVAQKCQKPIVVEFGPVVGVHIKIRQRGFADIYAVPDTRLSCFLRASACRTVIQLARHILPYLYINTRTGWQCVAPLDEHDWTPLSGIPASPGSQP